MADPTPEDVYQRVDDAYRRLRAALIATADRLDVPFTNAPELSPWSRSVKPALYALDEALKAFKADRDAGYAAGFKAGYGQGRDGEANGEELPEWYRLATGEICRPGMPHACGDWHENGKCVRRSTDG